MTCRPDISRSLRAQLIGASGADGSFNAYGNAPTVVGRMNLGMPLYPSRGIDLRLEYGLMLGGTYTGQTAPARSGYRFGRRRSRGGAAQAAAATRACPAGSLRVSSQDSTSMTVAPARQAASPPQPQSSPESSVPPNRPAALAA